MSQTTTLDARPPAPVVCWAEWHQGYRVCAPAIPGCVVIVKDLRHGMNLVGHAAVAIRDEGAVAGTSQ